MSTPKIKASAELVSPRELACERVSERLARRHAVLAATLRPRDIRYDLYERPSTNDQPDTEHGGHDMNYHDGLPCDPQDLDQMAADQADWDGGDDEVAADQAEWGYADYDQEELNGQLPLFASAQPEHVRERDLAQQPYGAIDREEDEDGLPFGPWTLEVVDEGA